MHCPFCRHDGSRVVDSRTTEDGTAIRRRRECPQCGRRFTTTEMVSLSVRKRNGVIEPFSREKVKIGVRRACQGRPVSDDDLALLAHQVELEVRASGQALVDSHDVGLAILGPLRELDEIAYLRFASVYSGFRTLEDFEQAIADLRAAHHYADAETEESSPQAPRPAASTRNASNTDSADSQDPEGMTGPDTAHCPDSPPAPIPAHGTHGPDVPGPWQPAAA